MPFRTHQITPTMGIQDKWTQEELDRFYDSPTLVGWIYIPQDHYDRYTEGVWQTQRKEPVLTAEETETRVLITADVILAYENKYTAIGVQEKLRKVIGDGYIMPVITKREHFITSGVVIFNGGPTKNYPEDVKAQAFNQVTIIKAQFDLFKKATKQNAS